MKTAMQILIDEMTSYLEVHESPEAREVLRILKASAIRKYKKEEREQIRTAYNQGRFVESDNIKATEATEYYNLTYNQN